MQPSLAEIARQNREFSPDADEGREVALPDGLSAADLKNLTPAQIAELIKTIGGAVGAAALLKLAAGHGGTPAGTQYNAAAFLVNAARAIDQAERADRDIGARLRQLPRAQLDALIDQMERKAKADAISNAPPPIPIDADA